MLKLSAPKVDPPLVMARPQRIATDVVAHLAAGDPIHGVFRGRAGIHPLFWGVCAVPLLVATRAPGSVGLWAIVALGGGLALAVVISSLMRHRIVAVTGTAIVVFATTPLLASRIRRVHTWLPRTTPLVVSAAGTWRRLPMGQERLWVHCRFVPLLAGLTEAPLVAVDAARVSTPA